MSRTTCAITTFLALLPLTGCDGPLASELDPGELSIVAEARPDRGRKTKRDGSEPEPAPTYAWYSLAVPDDGDPLSRFGLDGDLVLLESDPDAAGWGTDYWGYWSEPFILVDGTVTYVDGLTETTYSFAPVGEAFDVSREVVVRSYLGGASSVTRSHVGVFEPAH